MIIGNKKRRLPFQRKIGTIGGRGGARTAVGAYIEHTLGVIV